jgi:uncharacterized protein
MPRCPVCDASVSLEQTPTVPFCSDRCRLVDLGRWLDEAYGTPAPASTDEGDPELLDDGEG